MKLLASCLRYLLIIALTCCSTAMYASHIFGIELFYSNVTGNTYQITLNVYGDCASAIFSSLETATPTIEVYNKNSLFQVLTLQGQAPTTGTIVTPVCPADAGNTTCTNVSNPVPGITKFVYTANVTLNGTSADWRFVFAGALGSSSAGRAQDITNIIDPSNSVIQLVDTLNNLNGPNNSPVLTTLPTPFFCDNISANYNPGAVETNPADSVTYSLVPAVQAGGSPVSYVSGASPTDPLLWASGTFPAFTFDPSTGQISFTPNELQKSLIVYNVDQYLNGVKVGTCQREMTFVILSCSNPPPVGIIDTIGTSPGTVNDTDKTIFDVCQAEGLFSFQINPVEAGNMNNITVSSANLPIGSTFTITNNGTPTPHGVFSWNTLEIPLSNNTTTFNFFLTYQDNACPLASKQIQAYTVNLTPPPYDTIKLVSPHCDTEAIFNVIPLGKSGAVNILVLDSTATDTLQVFNNVTDSALLNGLKGGWYTIRTIAVGNIRCYKDTNIHVLITAPPAPPTITAIQPTPCDNGMLIVTGITSGIVDTVNFNIVDTAQQLVTPTIYPAFVTNDTIKITGLKDLIYNDITVTSNGCTSLPAPPDTLVTKITPINYTQVNPSACGINDGSIIFSGLPPNQVDVVDYLFNNNSETLTLTSDSSGNLTMNNLLQGVYANLTLLLGPSRCPTDTVSITLIPPTFTPDFTFDIHYGCNADTVAFTNTSQYSGNATFLWTFGDHTADTAINPTHIYTTQDTFYTTLILMNYHCIDSLTDSIPLFHPLKAAFTVTGDTTCQGQLVTFNNTSIGTLPLYLWNFGDGTSDTTTSPTHTYNVAGVYNVLLTTTDYVPCVDTESILVNIDSISSFTITRSDSVACEGKSITFTGNYSSIGNTGINWSFGDGGTNKNINPVLHGYDAPGKYTITATAIFRACPDTTTTTNVTVIPYPLINLGPDTSMCPGSLPIPLNDLVNASNPQAKWLWSTGDTTSGILAGSPDLYYTTVTLNGCSVSDSVLITNNCYVGVPNAFTPNGDGINDYFFPRQYLADGVVSFSMIIYNRWGQQVFSTTNTDGRGWDGKFNNELQPRGAYIYSIDVVFKNGQREHHQGNVTLLN